MRRYIKEALVQPTPLAYRTNARILIFMGGRWNQAITAAERAIELNPNDPDGYEAMGKLLVRTGKPAEAQVYLNEASRLNPNGDYSLLHASILFHLDRFNEAVDILQTNIENAPNDERNYLLLAASYAHLDRHNDARTTATKFNQLWAGKGYSNAYAVVMPRLRGVRPYWLFQDEAARDRFRDGLYNAGMPWSSVDGETPLHTASYEGRTGRAKLLVAGGAEIDARNQLGKTPLFHAVEQYHEEMVKLLIDMGTDPNIKDESGWTPLHVAVIGVTFSTKGQRIAIAEKLIAAGADVNVTDNAGLTPLDYATEPGMAGTLRQHGAKCVVNC